MRKLEDLPNLEGFKFIGVRHDGTLAQCYIIKDANGIHIIGGAATYKELKGWV